MTIEQISSLLQASQAALKAELKAELKADLKAEFQAPQAAITSRLDTMQSFTTTLQKGQEETQNEVKNLHNHLFTELAETNTVVTSSFEMLDA